jgi:hypothetical protein
MVIKLEYEHKLTEQTTQKTKNNSYTEKERDIRYFVIKKKSQNYVFLPPCSRLAVPAACTPMKPVERERRFCQR